MAGGSAVTCHFSVDDVKDLTVPKLKAELARLNQPLTGLKLKAHFADALTVSAPLVGAGLYLEVHI